MIALYAKFGVGGSLNYTVEYGKYENGELEARGYLCNWCMKMSKNDMNRDAKHLYRGGAGCKLLKKTEWMNTCMQA